MKNVQDAIKWENAQYTATKDAVQRMDDSVAGEDVVKSKRTGHLPHPCTDATAAAEPEQILRYDAFLAYAEYENVPGNTLDTLIGAMFRIDPVIDLDGMDEQLLYDSDGDGTALAQAMELTATECLQYRFEVIVVEYSDLAGIDPSEITVETAQREGLRATIKHYPRASVVDWSFKVVGGTKKLNMLVLREQESQVTEPEKVGTEGTQHTDVVSYLVLGLDAEGQYFQRRYRESAAAGQSGEWGEIFYPKANNETLKEIPAEIVYSSERRKGDIPKQLGYLDPISLKAMHRYKASALLKEALRLTAQPTSWSKGWTDQTFQQFKKATGKEYVTLGAGEHIPLFGEGEVGYLNWDADNSALFKYMDSNKADIIALGGVFNDQSESEATATEAAINSAEKKGVLSTLCKNIDESYMRVLGWVALFEGRDASNVSVKLNREFVAIKLSAQDRAAIVAEYNAALITRTEAIRQMERGGVLTVTAEALLEELEVSGDT